VEGALRKRIDGEVAVPIAMRYGAPSIEEGVAAMWARGVRRVGLVPLYPQFSAATTGSTLDEMARVSRKFPGLTWEPLLLKPDDTAWAEAVVQQALPTLAKFGPIGSPERAGVRVLLSFHGLPERQIRSADPTGARCLASSTCCDAPGPDHPCYRAQCLRSAAVIEQALTRLAGIGREQVNVAFQSRIGFAKWLGPDTESAIRELARQGTRDLVVIAPSFVADCLETIEELGIRGEQEFLSAGGRRFALVPSLNASAGWAERLASLGAAWLERP